MGYHIITDTTDEKPISRYISDLDELITQNHIPENSVIVSGEANATPKYLRHHDILKDYLDADKRLARRAELIFEKVAADQGYILQRIDQTPENYTRYQKMLGPHPKRSDYLLMNFANIEIDVQCLPVLTVKQQAYFQMKKSDVDYHWASLSRVKRHLHFAIFTRIDDWQISKSFGMITLEKVLECELINGHYLIPRKLLIKELNVLAANNHPVIMQKGKMILKRYPATPFYLVLAMIASFMLYENFPWISQFKQQFEIIFICSLSAFLLGRQWR